MLRTLRRRSSGQAVVLVFLLIVLATVTFAWIRRQDIYDWARLRNYDPPQQIQQLAFDTTMNNSARKLFYVYHPELNDREEFNNNCRGFGEHTIVLGCYVSNHGIFLFDIDDDRLEGVEQVTAAHEMLHAAYDRLGETERARVDKLVHDAFAKVTDERIRRSIDNYRSRDASVVPNELHSILATEVRNLPPELENYYKRYFTNRHAVVAYSEKYESVLTKRRNHAASLELQISGLRNEIEQLEKTLAAEKNFLQQLRGSVRTQADVQTYNSRVAAYNTNVRLLNSQISRHNDLIEEYKEVALEAQELYKALDSRPTL